MDGCLSKNSHLLLGFLKRPFQEWYDLDLDDNADRRQVDRPNRPRLVIVTTAQNEAEDCAISAMYGLGLFGVIQQLIFKSGQLFNKQNN